MEAFYHLTKVGIDPPQFKQELNDAICPPPYNNVFKLAARVCACGQPYSDRNQCKPKERYCGVLGFIQRRLRFYTKKAQVLYKEGLIY